MRKAVRLPIGIEPSLTRRPPNQTTATLDRLRITIIAGSMSAKTRLTRSAVPVSCSFATAKRSASESFRTKARITRTPVICSRSTSLMRSIFSCIERN